MSTDLPPQKRKRAAPHPSSNFTVSISPVNAAACNAPPRRPTEEGDLQCWRSSLTPPVVPILANACNGVPKSCPLIAFGSSPWSSRRLSRLQTSKEWLWSGEYSQHCYNGFESGVPPYHAAFAWWWRSNRRISMEHAPAGPHLSGACVSEGPQY